MKRKEKILNNLEKLIFLKNLTQSKISSRTGLSKPTVSNFLRGKSDLRTDYLDALLMELDIDLLKQIEEKLIESVKQTSPAAKPNKASWTKEAETILKGLDKVQRNTVLSTLLKVSSRISSEEVSQARESLKHFIKK